MPERRSARLRMARLVRATEVDRSFDLEFWEEVEAEGRLSAAWEMVLEVNAINYFKK